MNSQPDGEVAARQITMQTVYYLYQHTPNTSGQAFVDFCNELGIASVFESISASNLLKAAETKVDIAALPSKTLVWGNYGRDGFRPRERYAELFAVAEVRVLAFLRDPLDRAIAAYHSRVRRGGRVGATLGEHLRSVKCPYGSQFGFAAGGEMNCVDSFFFIGAAGHFAESCAVFATMIGEPAPPPPPLAKARSDAEERPECSEEDLQIFRDNNAADFEFYRRAVERLGDRYMSSFGAPLGSGAHETA